MALPAVYCRVAVSADGRALRVALFCRTATQATNHIRPDDPDQYRMDAPQPQRKRIVLGAPAVLDASFSRAAPAAPEFVDAGPPQRRRITPFVPKPGPVTPSPGFGPPPPPAARPAPQAKPRPKNALLLPRPPPRPRVPLEELSHQGLLEYAFEMQRYLDYLAGMPVFEADGDDTGGEKPTKRPRGDAPDFSTEAWRLRDSAVLHATSDSIFKRLDRFLNDPETADLYERDEHGNVKTQRVRFIDKNGKTERFEEMPIPRSDAKALELAARLDADSEAYWAAEKVKEDQELGPIPLDRKGLTPEEAAAADRADKQDEAEELQEEAAAQASVVLVSGVGLEEEEQHVAAVPGPREARAAARFAQVKQALILALRQHRTAPSHATERALEDKRADLAALMSASTDAGMISQADLAARLGLHGGTSCYDTDIGGKHLYPYQRMPARFLEQGPINRAGLLLAHNTGEGKTISAMAAIRCLLKRIGDEKTVVVVVAPLSVAGQWQETLKEAGIGRSIVVSHGLFNPGLVAPKTWACDSRLKKELGLAKFRDTDSEDPRLDAELKAKPFVASGIPFVLVVDEVHLFRPKGSGGGSGKGKGKKRGREAPDGEGDGDGEGQEDVLHEDNDSQNFPHGLSFDRCAARTQCMLHFAERATFVLTVTATPMPTMPVDMSVPLALALTAGYGLPVAQRLQTAKAPLSAAVALDHAARQLRALVVGGAADKRQAREDLATLVSFRGVPIALPTRARPGFPLVSWEMVPIVLTAEGTAAYDLKETAERAKKGSSLLPETRKATQEKLEALAHIVQMRVNEGQFGIIACDRIDTMKAIEVMLKDSDDLKRQVGVLSEQAQKPIAVVESISGNTRDREDIVAKFNAGQIAVLILSTAGAVGLNLARGRFVIFAEPQWTRSKTAQFAARVIRFGSHDKLHPSQRTVAVYETYTAKTLPGQGEEVQLQPCGPDQFEAYCEANKRYMTNDALVIARALRQDRLMSRYLRTVCEATALEHVFGFKPCHGMWTIELNDQGAADRVATHDLGVGQRQPGPVPMDEEPAPAGWAGFAGDDDAPPADPSRRLSPVPAFRHASPPATKDEVDEDDGGNGGESDGLRRYISISSSSDEAE